MNSKKLKFFLYIKVSNPTEVCFEVKNAVLDSISDNNYIFVGEHDTASNTTLVVELLSKSDPGAYIQIEKILVGGIAVNNFENWTRYITNKTGNAVDSHGWMSFPGKYFLKLRQSPLIHNYLTYFLSVCKNHDSASNC
jgi:hypothetical protein